MAAVVVVGHINFWKNAGRNALDYMSSLCLFIHMSLYGDVLCLFVF